MDIKKIGERKNAFDSIAHMENGVEFWYARELMPLLEYQKWSNFHNVIKKAMVSCETAKNRPFDHFADVGKMVQIGSNTRREVQDYMLTRYACYLIAQNGDPNKEEVAFAQAYFAVQTRKQEIIEDRLNYIERENARNKLKESESRLSKNIYERGVDEKGFGRIRSKGDMALFGGKDTRTMKETLGVPKGRPLADYLPSVTIAAKNLATEMTNFNVERKDLYGETPITEEHVQNNKSVRNMLNDRGINPENLPPAEDIKKAERRAIRESKDIVNQSGKLFTEESGEKIRSEYAYEWTDEEI